MVAVKTGNLAATKIIWSDFVNLDEQNVRLLSFLKLNEKRMMVTQLYI